jgi:hypothetical protein
LATQNAAPDGLTNVASVAAGNHFSLALRTDGTVVGWGYNNTFGQTSVPASLSNVVKVVAGDSHALALKSDGTVVAWGSNAAGQTNVPAGLDNVMDIAAGYSNSIALKTNGTVVAWGDNTCGQRSMPAGLSNIVSIAAGGDQVLALVSQRPTLQAGVTEGRLVLAWPDWAHSFRLQATTNAADPASWSALADVPVVVNQQCMATNAMLAGQRFYRLIR